MRTYQSELVEECTRLAEQINNTIDRHLPKGNFCEINREMLMRDINSNVLIKHSPSIIGIVEYDTKSYLYVSDNIVSELDITSEELISVGLARALMNFDDGHRKIFLEVLYPLIFEYYAKYAPTNEAKDLHVSYNTLLKTAGGQYKWYHHQLAVLGCDEKGFPRYAMKFLSNIDEQKKDEIISFAIHKKSLGRKPELIYCKNIFPHELNISYSPREKEILQLVAEGFTTKEIAGKLNLSGYTVSTHRKNIAKKAKTS